MTDMSGTHEHNTNGNEGSGGQRCRFVRDGECIIQSLSMGVVAFDCDLKIVQANSKASELMGLGQSLDETLARGTDSNVWNNWAELLKPVITDGQTGEFEAVRYEIDGQKKLLNISCGPVRDTKTQEIIGGTAVVEEVTEKVSREHQMAQTERLAAVGRVAGKVAHELNNPLDGILRYINLAMRIVEAEKLEKPKEYLEHCRAGLLRMVRIIGELLEFSRSTYAPFEHIRVDEVVADAVKAMDPKSSQVDIQIERDCPDGMPKIRGDSLFQVFCNLIKNAIDAMEGRGKLRIGIRCHDDVLNVEFRDTGTGFDPSDSNKLFQPFFTTKTHGRGTGLGLAICKDIVEKYNGRITAENLAEGGSSFTIHLPTTAEI